ncbi:MAG TPA: glycosyltransferase family 4 protein [Steroidobacteraceae bacterium]|nr:glycosyltransferase family 4 protein [Steroidobacteraceae bacterium]
MRLLILSFYYRPDLSAGSFRATALVEALQARAPAGTRIDVLTTLPNRYSTFTQDAAEVEPLASGEIRRIPLPAHRSDIRGQSRAFLHFAREVSAHVRDRHYDLVFATSSRLMTAALGARIAQRMRARLYLDIRDIFVDTITEILSGPASLAARLLFSPIESWTLRRADRVNLVSPGFAPYFRERYGDRDFAAFTNGIDAEFLAAAPAIVTRASQTGATGASQPGIATILYAGNIGEGQGLHEILPPLAAALRGRARFIVIGDGGRRELLQSEIARSGVDSVELRPPVPRTELIAAYHAADVLLLHLGRHAAFEKVLPSKLFEYAALGKPLLAGVAGYAARFVREEITNAAVFTPCDAAAAVTAFESLRLEDRPRPEFVARFLRSNIAAAMADDVLAVAARA